MRKFFVFPIYILLLYGCANIHSNYQQKLEPWIGKSARQLYADWGRPMHISPIDDQTIMATYYESETAPIDNDFEPYIGEMNYAAMAVPNYGLPPTTPLFYCQTSFIIRNGYIVDFNFSGDDCY